MHRYCLQQIVLAVVPAAVPSCPPQNPSCPATKVVPPVLDGAKKLKLKNYKYNYNYISLICLLNFFYSHGIIAQSYPFVILDNFVPILQHPNVAAVGKRAAPMQKRI